MMACVTKYTVVESHSGGRFSLRENIDVQWLFVQPYCGSCYVCVLGEEWSNPFWIVKFRISIPRINHKVENDVKNNRR